MTEQHPFKWRHYGTEIMLLCASTCSHPQILSSLPMNLQLVKAYSILLNSGFFRTDVPSSQYSSCSTSRRSNDKRWYPNFAEQSERSLPTISFALHWKALHR